MANATPDPTAGHTWWRASDNAIGSYADAVRLMNDADALVAALRELVEEYRPRDHWRRVRSGEAKCKGCPRCNARAVLAAVEERKA